MEYSFIVEKIKQNLVKDGFDSGEVNSIFMKSNKEALSYLLNLYETYVNSSRFYKEEDLIVLRKFKVPTKVIDFYSEFEPLNSPILSGSIKLLSLSSIKEENSSYTPSNYFIRFGIITIATSIGGNIICMDLNSINNNEPRIIIADHNFCSFNDELNVIECVNVPEEISKDYGADEPIILSYDIIKKSCPEISNTFSSFLIGVADKQFADIEKYLD